MNRHDFSAEKRAPACLLLVLALGTGCGQSQAPQERRIVPHQMPGCDATPNSGMVLTALGDFADPPAESLSNPNEQRDVPLPFNLRGVSTDSQSGIRGVGYANPPDDVHLSLWSSTQSCTPVVADIPPSNGGQAMTTFAGGNAVLVAGLEHQVVIADSAFALAWDTRTGDKLGRSELGANRRAWASATSFGDDALVAGGIDNRFVPPNFIDSALVFRKGAVDSEIPKIPLGEPRARHGATVLADGSTLLVGGEDENHLALPSMAVVVPTKDAPFGYAVIFGLGTLRTPRKAPTVLRLADDRILVAGGVDSMDEPVSTLEWFTKEAFACGPADKCPPVQALPTRSSRAFAALPTGGALSVGIDTDPSTKKTISDVWWIPSQGDPVALAPLAESQLPARDASSQRTKNLRLVPAANGSPWLWNGKAWFRFNPWLGTFVAPDSAPSDGPDDDLPVIAVDPGLMVWLQRVPDMDAGLVTRVRGFRHNVRGPLARDTPFIFLDHDPQHIVPDRPPGTDVKIENDGLHLANGGTVVIADATYGDVIVQGKTHSADLPGIKLGSSFMVGGDCNWVAASEADSGTDKGRSFEVIRSGTNLQLKVDSATSSCKGPEGRVSIALAALGSTPVVVSELTVTRTAPP